MKSTLVVISLFLVFLFTISLLLNKVGVDEESTAFESEDIYCQIDLRLWFMEFTVIIGAKLFLMALRYYCLKRNRKEHVGATILEVFLTNLMLTALFI